MIVRCQLRRNIALGGTGAVAECGFKIHAGWLKKHCRSQ